MKRAHDANSDTLDILCFISSGVSEGQNIYCNNVNYFIHCNPVDIVHMLSSFFEHVSLKYIEC